MPHALCSITAQRSDPMTLQANDARSQLPTASCQLNYALKRELMTLDCTPLLQLFLLFQLVNLARPRFQMDNSPQFV